MEKTQCTVVKVNAYLLDVSPLCVAGSKRVCDAAWQQGVVLGDAGAIVVGTLWGGASRHHAALEAALTAAAEGLWPKLVLAGVEIRKVGKTGGTNIVRLDASDASTVKVDPAASLTINVDDSILVKDFSELVSWEVRVGLRGVTL
ncbi:unnamed protein product [Cladocopium goreaui]|uniref:Uncharacterized protein n=1 Tax=Cladocopium goreaui TaxID=2562237 RepID=A0A9P1BM51_9DINO|nr:unnamed protein product [Cladocopium goreaui]